MSRSFNSINVVQSIDIGVNNRVSIFNDDGILSIESSGSTFPVISTSIIGATGPVGSIGITGPTGPSFSIETLTGASTIINPDINISVLSAGLTYTLSSPSRDGMIKYIVDDVDRTIFPSPTVIVNGNFYTSNPFTFYSSIRTVASNPGKQQGLVWLDDVGAWSIINNSQIFSYVS
jgi:hypothetical protein